MSLITVERGRVRPVRTGLPKHRQLRLGEQGWVFLAVLVVNISAAALLLSQDWLFNDGQSRVANGYFTVFSRDPHLAAIGFVWNPLPSLAAIPFLLLSPIFPIFASAGLAGALVSALCGAGAAALLWKLLWRISTPRCGRLALTAFFAAHPLILIGSADGASESMLLLTCLLAADSLLAWVSDRDPRRLVVVGLGLALAYLTRYEAVGPAALVIAAVLVLTWLRGGPHRRDFAANDAMLVGAPFIAVFAGWAITSKLIVGEWFATFSSVYGNSAQVGASRAEIEWATGSGTGGALGYLAAQLGVTSPLVVPLLIASVALSIRKRDLRPWAPIGILAAVWAFDAFAFLSGTSFGWLRFQVAAVPLGAFLAGYLWSEASQASRPKLRAWVAAGVIIALGASTSVSWMAMGDRKLAREEALMTDAAASGQREMERNIAAYIDGLSLPPGSVLSDVAYSSSIVLASRNPSEFVITPDRDFAACVADPTGHNVQYALVPMPSQAQGDAVLRTYPGFFDDGAGVATLAKEWKDRRGITWKLFRFNT